MIVYKVLNKATGEIYIGRTKQYLSARKSRHLNGNSGCPLLRAAIQKHGRDSFVFSIVARYKTEKALNSGEKRYITMLKPEYNMAKGGLGGAVRTGRKSSAETRKRISEAMKRSNWMKGRKWSKEHKDNISRKLMGNKNQSAKRLS